MYIRRQLFSMLGNTNDIYIYTVLLIKIILYMSYAPLMSVKYRVLFAITLQQLLFERTSTNMYNSFLPTKTFIKRRFGHRLQRKSESEDESDPGENETES